MAGSALGHPRRGYSLELSLGRKSGTFHVGFLWILKCIHPEWWKLIISPLSAGLPVGWNCKRSQPLQSFSLWLSAFSQTLWPSPLLCCRRDSAWRPSSVSVPSTQSPTAACPRAPPWPTCRRSIRSSRSCSCPTRSLCLKKPWWALMPGTGATRKAPSRMWTRRASGAAGRAVPASFPPGASGTMTCSGTSRLPFWKLPASLLILVSFPR